MTTIRMSHVDLVHRIDPALAQLDEIGHHTIGGKAPDYICTLMSINSLINEGYDQFDVDVNLAVLLLSFPIHGSVEND